MAPSDATTALTSPASALVSVPAHVVDVITTAMTHGTWGDTCFVVKSRGSDSAYACVYAHLASIRAAGAERLADAIMRQRVATLEEALRLLNISPRKAAAVFSTEESLRPLSPCSAGQRRYIAIRDLAFTTLRALLLFIQTGRVEFAPLNSTIEAGSTNVVSTVDDGQSEKTASFGVSGIERKVSKRKREGAVISGACQRMMATSPKSAYRAACKYDLESLRQLADHAMDEQITSKNILTELFDSFTFTYPEILRKRLVYVFKHWNDIPNKNELAQIFRNCPNQDAATDVLNTIFSRTSITGPSHC